MHLEEIHLTKEVFHVLVSLADRPRHGYGIIQDVQAATDGAVVLRTGTLYNILKRLLEEGLIAESDRVRNGYAAFRRRGHSDAG